jgi:outer membrane lipoprotein SlyB
VTLRRCGSKNFKGLKIENKNDRNTWMKELSRSEVEMVDGAHMGTTEGFAAGVTAGAAIGFLVGGPLGAVAGAISGGAHGAWLGHYMLAK